jgi:hypothetical protein
MSNAGSPYPPAPSGAGYAGSPQYPGLTLGQLLERTFKLLRQKLGLFVGLAMVPGAAMLLLMAAGIGIMLATILPMVQAHSRQVPDFSVVRWSMAPILAGYLLILPLFALYAAAAADAVVRSNLGEAISSAQAWSAAWKCRGRHIGLLFLLMLVVAGPIYLLGAVLFGIFVWLGGYSQGAMPPTSAFAILPLGMLLMIPAYVYAIFAFLRYSLSFAASIIEDLPARAALRRSAQLTRNAKGRIFVVLLVVYVATYVLIMACEILILFVGAIVFFMASALHLNIHSPGLLFLAIPLAVIVVGAVFLVIIALPYAGYSTALGVLYCDQRFRNEGALPALPSAEESV